MRVCPTCRTRYTDDTLRYCLQDGATLVEQLEAETPTVAFNEHETVPASRQTSARSGITSSRDEELTRIAAGKTSTGRRSGLLMAVIAVLAMLLVLVIAGAIGAWFYLKDKGTVSNSNNANVNANSTLFGNSGNVVPTPFPTIEAPQKTSHTPSPFPTHPSSGDLERAREEVSQAIHGWKSLAEALNLDSYMENYGDTIDYYNHSGASRSFVRNDKARAFTTYDSIRVNLSSMNVTVDESGNNATAVFDKEWDFRGSRNSSGKVQAQLQLRNVNGRWLIVGERDLKVYYTR